MVRACTVMVHEAVVRVQTQFRYPGGEYVELFYQDGLNGIEFTDFGQTMSQLLSLGVDVDTSARRQTYVKDVCDQLKIARRGAELMVAIEGDDDAATFDAFIRIGQGCVKVADLYLTHRGRLLSAFADDLVEGLESLGLPVDQGVEVPGRGGRQVTLDYLVDGPNHPTAILALTATNAARAHHVASDAFTKWYDLSEHQPNFKFVTVLDSRRVDQFREADIDRLEVYSSVLEFPEQADELRDIVMTD